MKSSSSAVNKSDPLFFEWGMTIVGIGFTVLAFFMFLHEMGTPYLTGGISGSAFGNVETLVFIGIVGFLVYGNLVYQCTRLGYFSRKANHQVATRQELEAIYERTAPSITVLVPSYKEEPEVVFQTLMSAALQEYSNLRVVLLIDDPPSPSDLDDRVKLEAMRALPEKIYQLCDEQKKIIEGSYKAWREREQSGDLHGKGAIGMVTHVSQQVREWFLQQAQDAHTDTHTDQWFIQKIFLDQANQCANRNRNLLAHMREENPRKIFQRVEREFQYLLAIFSCDVAVFERKQYANLSHESNKAMNLNTYIGLMGKTVFEQREGTTVSLLEGGAEAGHGVPDADYILTLDADSLLLPDYALRLVYFLEQPEHASIAVAQTPYSSIPKAPKLIERVAGATTDIQYIIHQGFTAFEGTYWVGANALLRKVALEDIAIREEYNGGVVTKYIQDRTVIEDTESSIDLINKGWELYNYPERLAYSATPPDFGSLLIQRRRWANGGLLILPNLLKFLISRPLKFRKLWQGFVRCHYLTSIAGVNFGVLLLLMYPFDDQLRSLWLPLTAVPYYFFYGRDLTLNGYEWKDLLRVYALNLLLIPGHIGGVSKSLHQAITKVKTPFCRTPKIPGRTLVPVMYLAAVYGLLLVMMVIAVDDFFHRYWMHMIFAMVNGGFLFYAVVNFVGFRSSWEDLCLSLVHQKSAYSYVVNAGMVFPKLLRGMLKDLTRSQGLAMMEYGVEGWGLVLIRGRRIGVTSSPSIEILKEFSNDLVSE